MTQGEATEFLLAEIEELETRLRMLPLVNTKYKLTPHETTILAMLLRNRGRVCSKEGIFNHLYQLRTGEKIPEPKIIDVIICKLRKKLIKENGPKIETVWGLGYAIMEEAKE